MLPALFFSCSSHDAASSVPPRRSKSGMKRQKLDAFPVWWMVWYLQPGRLHT
jgi:hypothetical protein